jgi:hypothetical protein
MAHQIRVLAQCVVDPTSQCRQLNKADLKTGFDEKNGFVGHPQQQNPCAWQAFSSR